MRISAKGQVTIPAHIREQAGFMPNTEVEFVLVRPGEVRLIKSSKKGTRKTRGELLVEHMWGKGNRKMTTDEIMKLMRGR